MAISSSIPNTEIIITTGQTSVTAQDLLNYIRELEDDFQMMSNSHIADAAGKAPLGGGVFTEIVLTLLEGNEGPWTIRFVDEGSAHTKVTGGTFLATDDLGAARNVTTNPALTINQSISGTLVETGVSGLTPTESAYLTDINGQLTGIENGMDHNQLMRALFSSICCKLSGAPTGPIYTRDMTDTKDRMTVTVDEYGNRTAIVWDLTP